MNKITKLNKFLGISNTVIVVIIAMYYFIYYVFGKEFTFLNIIYLYSFYYVLLTFIPFGIILVLSLINKKYKYFLYGLVTAIIIYRFMIYPALMGA